MNFNANFDDKGDEFAHWFIEMLREMLEFDEKIRPTF
jgi:hypothetical protein